MTRPVGLDSNTINYDPTIGTDNDVGGVSGDSTSTTVDGVDGRDPGDGRSVSAPGHDDARANRGSFLDRMISAFTGRAAPADASGTIGATMRDKVKDGTLDKYYDAVVNDTELKAEALEFFKSLPKVGAHADLKQLVKLGLIPGIPKGWEAMDAVPRYIPGRQMMVETSMNLEKGGWGSSSTFGTYKHATHLVGTGPNDQIVGEEGNEWLIGSATNRGREVEVKVVKRVPKDDTAILGLTHRATLVGVDGNDFLVHIDGEDDPVKVPKSTVARLNQPHVITQDRVSLNGLECDYNDPFTKAKVHEGFARLYDIIEKIDYTKAFVENADGTTTVLPDSEVFRLQEKAVGVIHDIIHTQYSHDMNSGDSIGRLAIKGSGQCFSQAAAMIGLLAPFTKLLGIELQFVFGKVYRDITVKPNAKYGDVAYYPYNGGNHGFLQVTYKPGFKTMITDRTWSQRSIAMDRAYSLGGDRVPRSLMPIGYSRSQESLTSKDVDMSLGLKVKTEERLFGDAKTDGRVNHQ